MQSTRCKLLRSLLLLSICGFFFYPNLAQAGPWSKDTGGFYVKLNQNVFLANGFRNAQGVFQDDVFYTGITTSAYFEVGIYGGLQVIGNVPYTVAINAFSDGARFTQGSPGDAQLGLQWMPQFKMPVVMAVRLNVWIPMYDINTFTDRYPDVGSRFPVHGDGQVDVTLWYSIGGTIPRTPLYTFAEVGYRFRTEAFMGQDPGRAFLDTFVFNFQLGWTFWRRLIMTANVRGTIALGEDTLSQSFITVGPGFYLPVWKGLAIELSYDATVWAKNASMGHSVALGISYNK